MDNSVIDRDVFAPPWKQRDFASFLASGRVGESEARLAKGEAMQRKVMIACAVTGSADTPGRNPAVPVTPQQIAQSAIDAAKAGAAIVHVHVRDPVTTRPSMDGALYREVVDRIRSRSV